MENYAQMLDFYLRNQEANRLAFETAKYVPFLFIGNPSANPQVEPWQPLLFEGNPANPPHIEP